MAIIYFYLGVSGTLFISIYLFYFQYKKNELSKKKANKELKKFLLKFIKMDRKSQILFINNL